MNLFQLAQYGKKVLKIKDKLKSFLSLNLSEI